MTFSVKNSLGRLAGLIVVTLFALAVMAAGSVNWVNRSTGPTPPPSDDDAGADPRFGLPAPVVVRNVAAEKLEITDVYSGKIKPFERFALAFEIAGRVEKLGKTKDGQPIDEGSIVAQGDTLAVLDRELLQAREKEAEARLKEAKLNLQRLETIRRTSPGTVSATDRVQRETEVAVAEALLAIARKNLKNASLHCPVRGVVSKRHINPGESINMHQPCFEVVQVDRVLLVVGVPESKIQPIIARQQASLQRQTYDGGAKAYVQVLGKQPLGPKRDEAPPQRTGQVYRISQTADDASGLFEVEILLDNEDGSLRPGQIGVASIVIDEVEGIRVDSRSVLFQEDGAHLFVLENGTGAQRWLFFDLGQGPQFTARRYTLDPKQYVEQGSELVVRNLPENCRQIVVNGQHRLVDGRKVFIVREL